MRARSLTSPSAVSSSCWQSADNVETLASSELSTACLDVTLLGPRTSSPSQDVKHHLPFPSLSTPTSTSGACWSVLSTTLLCPVLTASDEPTFLPFLPKPPKRSLPMPRSSKRHSPQLLVIPDNRSMSRGGLMGPTRTSSECLRYWTS